MAKQLMYDDAARTELRDGLKQIRWTCFEAGQSFALGDITIESFRVMHDAVDPVGFVFRSAVGSLGYLCDLGHVPDQLHPRMGGLDCLFVEANYDERLLESDQRRPWGTKQRICSQHGHLSNTQAAATAAALAHPGMRQVVLGHLSRDCNEPALAVRVVRERLSEAGWGHVAVACATQHEPTPWWRVE